MKAKSKNTATKSAAPVIAPSANDMFTAAAREGAASIQLGQVFKAIPKKGKVAEMTALVARLQDSFYAGRMFAGMGWNESTNDAAEKIELARLIVSKDGAISATAKQKKGGNKYQRTAAQDLIFRAAQRAWSRACSDYDVWNGKPRGDKTTPKGADTRSTSKPAKPETDKAAKPEIKFEGKLANVAAVMDASKAIASQLHHFCTNNAKALPAGVQRAMIEASKLIETAWQEAKANIETPVTK